MKEDMTSNARATRLAAALIVTAMLAGDAAPSAAVERREPPRLVVLIVVDQLRADLVTRFARHFGDGGFNRLDREGAFFANAYFSYGPTETAPGHATIATGRLPRQHGIIANKWHIDPNNPRGTLAIADPDVRQIPARSDGSERGASPRALIGPAFGDQLKLSDRRSRVFSVSLKDRAAIFSAGQRPDGVYWWDIATGKFVTSTWYAEALPEYVASYNAARPAERWAGQVWKPLLAPEAYEQCHAVDAEWDTFLGLGHAFPHMLPNLNAADPGPYFRALWCTPFGNELVFELAERVLAAERLGLSQSTDMLCIGLSSNDLVGHYFGPDSPEMMDMTLQTDQQLARFLKTLDEHVGLDRCLIALTADHGATTTPKLSTRLGLGGGVLDVPKLEYELNDRLQGFFPTPSYGEPPHTIVLAADVPWIHLNRKLWATLPVNKQKDAIRRAVVFLKNHEGITDVFTAEELSGAAPSRDDRARWMAWRAYHPERAGELYVRLAPFWYKTDDKIAGHDCGSNHDQHVPIYLRGPRVRPGRYFAPADPCDIAVTLAALLGIEPPLDAVGRVLHEALDTRAE